MHELSIATEVLRIVQQQKLEHGFDGVRAIRIRAGALSNIVPEALEFAFRAISEDTCAAGAKLEMELQPLVLLCNDCGHHTPAEHGPRGCASCGSTDVRLEGTTRFEVVSLEVDTPSALEDKS